MIFIKIVEKDEQFSKIWNNAFFLKKLYFI